MWAMTHRSVWRLPSIGTAKRASGYPAARIARSLSSIAGPVRRPPRRPRRGRRGRSCRIPGRRPRRPGQVVAEPEPLRLGQVLDQTKDGGAAVDRTRRSCSSDSPSAFFSTQCRANDRNARAVSSSPESNAWHGLPLDLRHTATVTLQPDQTGRPPPPGRAGCRTSWAGSMILAQAGVRLRQPVRRWRATAPRTPSSASSCADPTCSYPATSDAKSARSVPPAASSGTSGCGSVCYSKCCRLHGSGQPSSASRQYPTCERRTASTV